jgi:hypothetical protein
MRGQYGRTAAKANSRTLVQRRRPAGNLQQINVFEYGLNQKTAFGAAYFTRSAGDNLATELARILLSLMAMAGTTPVVTIGLWQMVTIL